MSNTSNRKQAIVIGGGIAGLTTCYRLITESAKRGIPLDVKLLEAGDRVGGAIHTSKQDGFVIEHGPDVFISTKPWAKALSEELGIADQFLSTNQRERRSFVLRKGKLYPVPDGFYLMAPASFLPFVKTPIFSWHGKLRMGLDWVIPRRRNDEDESLEGFITRRLGKEAFTRIAQPMIGGIYTADGKDLSLKATMPQFLEMEKKHRSIIKALIARKKESQGGASGTSGPRYSLFLSFKSGMQTLTDTLAERLPDDCIQLGTKVSRLDYRSQVEAQPKSRSIGEEKWHVHLANGEQLEGDLVCVALPAHGAAGLVKTVAPSLSESLASIPYASSAIVNLAFRRADIEHPLNGMGFVVPAIEERSIIGCTFSSVKLAGRAPEDYALLRAYVGGAGSKGEAYFRRSESEIVESVLRELHELLGLRGDPQLSLVYKHPNAMAQYHLGHLDKVAEIEVQARKLPGFALAGNAYHGIGIPDCINSGEKAASLLLEHGSR